MKSRGRGERIHVEYYDGFPVADFVEPPHHNSKNPAWFAVEKDFIAQSGDPTGTGMGGQSVFAQMNGEKARFFEDEIHDELRHKVLCALFNSLKIHDCPLGQPLFSVAAP